MMKGSFFFRLDIERKTDWRSMKTKEVINHEARVHDQHENEQEGLRLLVPELDGEAPLPFGFDGKTFQDYCQGDDY